MQKDKKSVSTMSDTGFVVLTLILAFFCMSVIWGAMEVLFELLRLIFKL